MNAPNRYQATGRVNVMLRRFADWQRERRIKRLTRELVAAIQARLRAHEIQRKWQDEVNARSPEQVARMERRKGLR